MPKLTMGISLSLSLESLEACISTVNFMGCLLEAHHHLQEEQGLRLRVVKQSSERSSRK